MIGSGRPNIAMVHDSTRDSSQTDKMTEDELLRKSQFSRKNTERPWVNVGK